MLRIVGWCLASGAAGASLVGCGHGASASAVSAPAAPIVTAITLLGTTSEPSAVTGTATADGGPTIAAADTDPRPAAWSLSIAHGHAATECIVSAVDGVGNRRRYAIRFSSP